jgi:lipopolysaccharide/colanic/teichoic acid biosynthesis glycosyltransferase
MKRIFDIIFSLFGLLVFGLLMIVVAVVIKLTSKGPVFYRQVRTGLHRRPFRVYKFRTMLDKADTMGSSVTTGLDPRITPVGRVLRRTKLDELPQLINVLNGQMSFVGPRPDVPEITDKYTKEMLTVFEAKPGITSLATLHFRREEEILAKVDNPDQFYEEVVVPLKVTLAMEHARKNSFLFDLDVLFKTLWMLTPTGKLWPVREHPLVTQFREQYKLQY